MSDISEALRNAKSDYEKKLMQYNIACAFALRKKIVDKVDSNFGGRVVGDRKITAGFRGGSSGALRNSIRVVPTADRLRITAGNANVPYAAIHEYGGIIQAKKAKYLTIPIADKYRARRAREFNLIFVDKKNTFPFLYDPVEKRVAYLLRKSVKIPARPYIRPSIKEFIERDAEEIFNRILKK